MNKEWSELNKDAKILLNKKSSFKDGINKLIQLRTLLINEWKNAMKDLSIEDYSRQPFINKDGYECLYPTEYYNKSTGAQIYFASVIQVDIIYHGC